MFSALGKRSTAREFEPGNSASPKSLKTRDDDDGNNLLCLKKKNSRVIV